MNYSKTLNSNIVGEPYKRKMCSWFELSIYFNGCDYSKGNGYATNDIMTQQWNKCAHLTNNAKCNFV